MDGPTSKSRLVSHMWFASASALLTVTNNGCIHFEQSLDPKWSSLKNIMLSFDKYNE